MSYLAHVTHDTQANTLEATWAEPIGEEIKRVKCRNYSPDQKADFLADCGTEGQKYVDMAGW